MRTTLDEFTWLTMDAMADDWESLEQIVPHVEHFVDSAERARVARLLIELVSEGAVREMEQLPYRRLTAEMILGTPIEYWFSMTPAGRALWDSEGHKYRDETVPEPCAPPNGGPATQLGSSGVTEGPPSVS